MRWQVAKWIRCWTTDSAELTNTIESGIDIDLLGGIDIGIDIDKIISQLLILVLIL